MSGDSKNNRTETRVLFAPPTRRDGEVTSSLLADVGLVCEVFDNLVDLANALSAGAGAVLLTEEALADDGVQQVLRALDEQPAWSDLPVVMLMQGGVASPAASQVLGALRNVTLLERPAPTRSVVSAVQAAVRARHRQYEIRASQIEREQLLESERAARQEAEHAGRMKDEFLATLSHELRTPLNAILGWAQLMKMSPDDPQTLREGIDVIDRNVRIQTQLIEDLLDMSRIISGKVRLDIERVELAEVIETALTTVLPAITAKGIRLEKTIEPLAGSVSADPNRLQQVLWNLLTNAIKFTPKGGQIHVRGEQVKSHVEITVSDTGEGIPPEFLPQLFERFTQADASSRRQHGGLGLGLSIVKSLVEMHGGKISAKSRGKGQGATFIIQLPLHGVANNEGGGPLGSASNREMRSTSLKLTGLKILVVDDEPDARELVRRFLLEREAIPALASSAAEAQVLLQTFKPDVIISDIGMPIQDGYQFMRAVRIHGLKTPAVALTAFARSEDRIRSIEAGFQAHLPKPVEPAELIAVVASLAGRYETP